MKKIEIRIKNLGLDYKKEFIKFIIACVFDLILFFTISFILKSFVYILLSLLGLLLIIVYFMKKYSDMELQNKKNLILDFIEYFGFFRIYIFNKESVYKSLSSTVDLASKNLKPYIENLLSDINNDKTIKPYMDFANIFHDKLIEEIMISIYEMVENGTDSNYLNQFTTLFEDYKNRVTKEVLYKRISKYDLFINSSLVGSGLIMIILVFGIINLVGEIIWVRN